jgi:hypothetical protein
MPRKATRGPAWRIESTIPGSTKKLARIEMASRIGTHRGVALERHSPAASSRSPISPAKNIGMRTTSPPV